MEILVDHSLGIPSDAVLSVRCGGTRRQAPMETISNHPLKFPVGLGEVGEPLKIDLLQPLASARLVLHPYEDLYSISFQEKGGMLLGMKMSASSGAAATDAEVAAAESQGKDAANSAKDYLEQHGLLKYVQSLLHAVIQAKPVDPYAYMIEQLSKRVTLADIVSRPGSAVGNRRPVAEQVRPVPPSQPPPNSSPPGRPRPREHELVRVPAEDSSPWTTEKPLVPKPPEKEAPPLNPLPGDKQMPLVGLAGTSPVDEPAPSVDGVDQEHPDDSLEQVRLQLKSRLEDAFRKGELEEAVRRAIEPDEPGAEEATAAAEVPGVEAPDEQMVTLKVQLKALLADAVETKGLKETLASIRPPPATEEPLIFAEPDPRLSKESTEQDEILRVKKHLRTRFEDGLESGDLEKSLPRATAPMEVEDIKDKMRQLLQNSVSTGSLEPTLEKIKANPQQRSSTNGSASEPPARKDEEAAPVAKPTRVRDQSYAGMILQLSGSWFLNGVSGRYDFDDETGWLSDQTGDAVGRFRCQRLQDAPLRFPPENYFSKLRGNLGIVSSEIMAEIHKKSNRGALFVIPSQFNGAEYPYHTDVVYNVEDYKHENGSGPRGQLAVHPAIAQFILDNAANMKREGGINALDQVLSKVPGLELVNGYLQVDEAKSSTAQEQTLRRLQENLHSLRPLVMDDVCVRGGLTADQREIARCEHKVGFVYASAVPVDSYLNRDGDSEYQMRVAELLLVAQYYGALKYAAESMRDTGRPQSPSGRRTRKVYLMPLGTGVFHNSWEIIAKSMAKAVQMLDDQMISLLDISALARQGNPSEELKLQETFYKLNKNCSDDSIESTKIMLREMLESAAENGKLQATMKQLEGEHGSRLD